ncbi:MAG: nucleotidyltransferase domain-containing protein [bacterium]|nr:nucleotidyltransferase domain-containing protein [bacterium]
MGNEKVKKSFDYLSKTEKKIIIAFVKELREKFGENILSVRLFGSKVRGDFTRDSDIDIFILVREKKDVRDKISDISYDYFFKTNLPLSTVVYSLFEYEKNKELGSFFFENIEKEGIIL